MKWKSQKSYLKNPEACPVCGAGNACGNGLDYESGKISQKMTCIECEAKWRDVYVLVGYVKK